MQNGLLYTFLMQRFRGIGLRLVSFNTFFQFSVRLIGSGTSLISTLIIASFLGYPTIGSFIKVVEFVAIFYILLDFGLNPVFQKLYVKKIEISLGNLVVTRLIFAVVLVPIIAFVTLFLPQSGIVGAGFSDQEKFAIIIYSLTLFSSALNISWQALLQQKLGNRLTIPTSLLSSFALLSVIYYAASTANFYLLFGAFIVSGSVYSISTYLLIKARYKTALSVSKLAKFIIRLFMVGWPLGIVLFINFLYARIDIFLLAILKQNVDVGIYGISYRFFDVAVAIPTFLASSTYPLLLSTMDNKKVYYSHFRRYLLFYAIISFIVTIFVVFFSPLIQILRKEFLMSVAPLQILGLSLPFFFLTSLLQWHFLIKGKVFFLLPLYGGVLILNVVLNIIFIPHYSYFASAVITALCEGIVFIVLLWYFLKDKKA